MASDANIIGFEVPEGDIDTVIEYLKQVPTMVETVARKALPRIGREILIRIQRDGPRSAVHRGPAKRPHTKKLRRYSDAWRSDVVHAIDTIKVSTVKRDKFSNAPYVVVGPGRGDNSPSFYLKFFEYGTAGDKYKGRPFIRPARREVMADIAPAIVVEEMNKQLREGPK